MSRVLRQSIRLFNQISMRKGPQNFSSGSSASFVSEFMNQLDDVIPPLHHEYKGTNNKKKGSKNKNRSNNRSPVDAALRNYATKLRQADRSSQVMDTLEELMSGKLSQNIIHYSAAFDRLRELKKWQDVIQVFNFLKADPTILALVEPQGSEVESYMEDALIENRLKYRRLYNMALNVYGKVGEWKQAFDLIDEMTNWKTNTVAYADWMKPDSQNFTSAFTACSRAKDPEQSGQRPIDASLALLALMRKRGDLIHPYAYHAIMETCARNKQWELVSGLLTSMNEDGIEPTVATLVHALHPDSGIGLSDAVATISQHLTNQYNSEVENEVGLITMNGDNKLIPFQQFPSHYLKNRLLEICCRDDLWREALVIYNLPVVQNNSIEQQTFIESHTNQRSAEIKRRQQEIGLTIGTTIVLQTLSNCQQWDAMMSLIDGIFESHGSAPSLVVDEKLIKTIASSAMKVHGSSFLKCLDDLDDEATRAQSDQLTQFVTNFSISGKYAQSALFQSTIVASAIETVLYRDTTQLPVDFEVLFKNLQCGRMVLESFSGSSMGMAIDDRSYDKLFNFIHKMLASDSVLKHQRVCVFSELSHILHHMTRSNTTASKDAFNTIAASLKKLSQLKLTENHNVDVVDDDKTYQIWNQLSNVYRQSIDNELSSLKKSYLNKLDSGKLNYQGKVLAASDFVSKKMVPVPPPPLLKSALASFAMWSTIIQEKTLLLQYDKQNKADEGAKEEQVDMRELIREKSVAAGVNAVSEAIQHVRANGWLVDAKAVNQVATSLMELDKGYLAFALLHVLSLSNQMDETSQQEDLPVPEDVDNDFLDMSELRVVKSSPSVGRAPLVPPVLSSYHTAMRAAAEENEIDLALSVILDMKNQGMEPTPETARIVLGITKKRDA